MSNNILSYTSRDFKSIKQDLINAIPSLTDIWTNREESDPGMVLLTLMAALGDNLSFNMDRQSLEFFGQTVTQRKNAARVFDLVAYKMHWYESAKLEVTIYNNNPEQIALLFNIASTNSQRLVSSTISSAPAYFLLHPEETPSNWNENKVISIPSGNSVTFEAVQGDLNSISFSSTAIDANNRYYLPLSKIDQNHIWLADDKKYQWYLVKSINELTETVPRFEFGIDEYNLPYIQFVPYWRTSFGEIHNFTLYYLSTRGVNGGITANTLNLIPTLKRINGSTNSSFNDNIQIVHGSNVYNSTNINNAPGKDPQTAEDAYIDSRNYIGTYNTLVTLIDFENFMNRLGLISAVKAIDGQYATEVNEKILNALKTKYRNYDNSSDIILFLYDATKLVFENYEASDQNNDGQIDYNDDILDHFGFKPYSLQLHMIAGNFQLVDLLNGSITIADETTITVNDDPSINDGYISYMLSDNVVGTSDDSTVSQSGINNYKLFTADVTYAPVRKFPFFVNGQIHLKEPMRPAEANLVLYNVYSALVNRFNANNLTIGEKINFKDILDTINNADENIYYFDAGANSSTGSLIEYPTTSDFNYTTFNYETLGYDNFDVNINPEYFNEVSLQAYADIIQNNNVLMYFGNTFSNRLTIADDSISNKDNPPVYNTFLDVILKINDDDNDQMTATLNVFTLKTDGSIGDLIIDGAEVFRYALLKTAVVDCTNIDAPSWDIIVDDNTYPVEYYNMSEISQTGASKGSDQIKDWSKLSAININIDNYTTIYKKVPTEYELPIVKGNLVNPPILQIVSVKDSDGQDVTLDTSVADKVSFDFIDTGDNNNTATIDLITGEVTLNNPTYDIPQGYTVKYTIASQYISYGDQNSFIFGYAITETITTNESNVVFSEIKQLQSIE